MPFDASTPYNDLPLLPPPGDLETAEVLKKCIDARLAVAELKHTVELMPNASLLANALPMLEAQASSEIENICTTADKLFAHVEGPDHRADPATREALRYRRALLEGVHTVRAGGLSIDTAIEICRAIKDQPLDIRSKPGTSLRNAASGAHVYTPPEGRDVIRAKLENWLEFVTGASNLDPLVRVAAAHYQFEAIHPFPDGNGRTGRILNNLHLVELHLLDTPILLLSRYIIRNKADYYRLLLEVTTDGRWEAWILYVLAGIEAACLWTTDKIKALRGLMLHTGEHIRRRLPKICTSELVELLFEQPYCRIANVVDAGLAKRQTASVYLKRLADIGVLREIRSGRESLFVHPKYLELLTGDENVWAPYGDAEAESA